MKVLEKFCEERNLKKSTIRLYYSVIKDYTNFHKKTIEELLNESDAEEEQGIRAKNRKLRERLINYRQHKIETKTPSSTVNAYFNAIKTIYRHFGIEIPYIPPAKLRQNTVHRYTDIPTLEHVKKALQSTSNLKYKAMILFIASSGTGRAETLNLTVEDFIKATREYHNSYNLHDILKELDKQDDIVPVFDLTRQKTGYQYYTCCSPEAVQAIIVYLKSRQNLSYTDSLFGITNTTAVTRFFQRINNKNRWGKVGANIFFRPHTLRKFHASAIEDIQLVNALQGRKPDPVTEAYFKRDPERLRKKYIAHLDKLTVNKIETITLKSKEYKKLELKYNEIVENNKKIEEKIDKFLKDQARLDDDKDYLDEVLEKIK